jgi:hypothetical protein
MVNGYEFSELDRICRSLKRQTKEKNIMAET